MSDRNCCRHHKTRYINKNLDVKHCLNVRKNTTLEKNVFVGGNLQVKNNIKSTQLDSTTINTNTLNLTTINTTSIVTTDIKSENAEIVNLTVDQINGRPINCGQTFTNTNSDISRVINNEEPANPGNFNQVVWDKLWEITQLQMASLSDRLQCGRLQEKLIQEKFNCVVCPPDQLVNCHPTCSGPEICECPNEEGECPRVPISIWGIKSIPPFVDQLCSSDFVKQLSSTIAYNLDVINVTGAYLIIGALHLSV